MPRPCEEAPRRINTAESLHTASVARLTSCITNKQTKPNNQNEIGTFFWMASYHRKFLKLNNFWISNTVLILNTSFVLDLINAFDYMTIPISNFEFLLYPTNEGRLLIWCQVTIRINPGIFTFINHTDLWMFFGVVLYFLLMVTASLSGFKMCFSFRSSSSSPCSWPPPSPRPPAPTPTPSSSATTATTSESMATTTRKLPLTMKYLI